MLASIECVEVRDGRLFVLVAAQSSLLPCLDAAHPVVKLIMLLRIHYLMSDNWLVVLHGCADLVLRQLGVGKASSSRALSTWCLHSGRGQSCVCSFSLSHPFCGHSQH